MIEIIKIIQNEEIIAHYTTESSMSSYGQPVWMIIKDPEPGIAEWRQGDHSVEIEILFEKNGWLICKQPDGVLCGIIWTDGSYFADLIIDENNQPCTEFADTNRHVRNTLYIGNDDIGSIIG